MCVKSIHIYARCSGILLPVVVAQRTTYKRNAASVNSTELLHTCYYTLGKKSKFIVANKSGETFAEKGGGRGARAAGAWGVASRIGWVLSVVGMISIESPLAHSRQNLEKELEL